MVSICMYAAAGCVSFSIYLRSSNAAIVLPMFINIYLNYSIAKVLC